MAGRAGRWDEAKREFVQRVRHETDAVFDLEGRGGRWASGPAGSVAIMASDDHGGRWFLGLDEAEFRKRGAIGVILLCRVANDLIVFGIPAARVDEFLSNLPRDEKRGERKWNIVRRGGRYMLQIAGGNGVDLADFLVSGPLRDLAWLKAGRNAITRRDVLLVPFRSPVPTTAAASGPATVAPRVVELASEKEHHHPETTFFARVRKGVLEPLDSIDLPEGAVVLVRTTPTRTVPRIQALRRIVAAGGPVGLPRDFAEQHDHYAHGGPRP